MSRLENAPSRLVVVRMTAALVDIFCCSFPNPPAAITLDIDDTCDAVHGQRQLSLFNAHYDTRQAPARHAQRAEARGIEAEIGAQRRLQRIARPRSGSPNILVAGRPGLLGIGDAGSTNGRQDEGVLTIARRGRGSREQKK